MPVGRRLPLPVGRGAPISQADADVPSASAHLEPLLLLVLSTESRRALRDLVHGEISTPPVAHGARPLPLDAARKERS